MKHIFVNCNILNYIEYKILILMAHLVINLKLKYFGLNQF